MACPAVLSGGEFLVRTLAHLDCQAQTLGSFGFQSLAAPGSPAFAVLTAALTLFIALYAIQWLFGRGDEPRDLVQAVLKIGIVLTLAISWPAWRVLAYDTVLYGPSEVAAAIMPGTLPDPRADFPRRLQAIDGGVAALTIAGTGRQTGQVVKDGSSSDFRAAVLADETSFGWARPLFLAGTLGPLAALRLAAGLLLALAPLFAGLLLFEATRSLFAGWLRGLLFAALGSLGVTVLLSVQLAIMEPWLADVLQRRGLGYAAATAPTELLALVLGFGAASLGLLAVLGRVAFHDAAALHRPALQALSEVRSRGERPGAAEREVSPIAVHARARAIAGSVETTMRRDGAQPEGGDRPRTIGALPAAQAAGAGSPGRAAEPRQPLGSGYHRSWRRDNRSQRSRDARR